MRMLCTLLALVAAGLVSGCARENADPSKDKPAAAIDASRYILAQEPSGARGVLDVNKEAKDGDDVVIVGQIGGRNKPWVDGRAAFFVADLSVEA